MTNKQRGSAGCCCGSTTRRSSWRSAARRMYQLIAAGEIERRAHRPLCTGAVLGARALRSAPPRRAGYRSPVEQERPEPGGNPARASRPPATSRKADTMSVNGLVTNRGAVYDVRLRTVDGSSYKRSFRTRREAEVFEARGAGANRSRGTWLDPRRAEASLRRSRARVAREQPGEEAGNARPRRRHRPPAPHARDRPRGRSARSRRAMYRRSSSDGAGASGRAPSAVSTASCARSFASPIERDYIGRTPCRGIKLPEVEQADPSASSPALTSSGWPIELGPNHAPMAYLGAVLGLRWGECAGLRVGRVDFLRSTLDRSPSRSRAAGWSTRLRAAEVAGRPTDARHADRARRDAHRASRTPRPQRVLTATLSSSSSEQGGPLRYERWRRRVWLPAVRRSRSRRSHVPRPSAGQCDGARARRR